MIGIFMLSFFRITINYGIWRFDRWEVKFLFYNDGRNFELKSVIAQDSGSQNIQILRPDAAFERLRSSRKKYQPVKGPSENNFFLKMRSQGQPWFVCRAYHVIPLKCSDYARYNCNSYLKFRTKIAIFNGIHNQMICADHSVSLSILVTNDCELRLTCDRLGNRG